LWLTDQPDALSSAVILEQCGDPAVAVPAVLRCQADDLLGEGIFVIGNLELATLRGPWLFQDVTGGAFTCLQSFPDMFNTLAAA
jgi:hypothetical protein